MIIRMTLWRGHCMGTTQPCVARVIHFLVWTGSSTTSWYQWAKTFRKL